MHYVAVTGRFAGEKVSHAVGAVTNAAGKAAGWVGDGAHYTYDGVSNTAGAVKDAAYNAAAAAGDQTRSTILSVSLPFFSSLPLANDDDLCLWSLWWRDWIDEEAYIIARGYDVIAEGEGGVLKYSEDVYGR